MSDKPINMVLHCPNCGMQHIDAPDPAFSEVPVSSEQMARAIREGYWINPPHRSHLCHGCGHIWRPADVPTNGVAAVKTQGKNDSPVAGRQPSQAPVVQAVPVNCGTGHCSCIECVVEPQAVRMLTKEEPEKCYSLDEETFYDLGELIDMLDEEQAKPGFLVYEGESVRHTASHYARGAVAYLFERMGEQAFDDAGEHIGDWPDHAVKDDNSAELEKLIYDWLDANVRVHFYTVKNVRQIALTPEMLSDDDAGRAIPPSGVIGDAA